MALRCSSPPPTTATTTTHEMMCMSMTHIAAFTLPWGGEGGVTHTEPKRGFKVVATAVSAVANPAPQLSRSECYNFSLRGAFSI
jgi:hypothetical protein